MIANTAPRHYHLIGIGGTAMASLAGLLKAAGHRVTGSDENVYPPMSDQLGALGIHYFEGYAAANLAEEPEGPLAAGAFYCVLDLLVVWLVGPRSAAREPGLEAEGLLDPRGDLQGALVVAPRAHHLDAQGQPLRSEA